VRRSVSESFALLAHSHVVAKSRAHSSVLQNETPNPAKKLLIRQQSAPRLTSDAKEVKTGCYAIARVERDAAA
jgi:hypothetical protein